MVIPGQDLANLCADSADGIFGAFAVPTRCASANAMPIQFGREKG